MGTICAKGQIDISKSGGSAHNIKEEIKFENIILTNVYI